jgi:short-subunit dehydrogenase
MSKNAVVFGATSGIGKELAKLLVRDGYKVLITGRRKERLEAIMAENPGQIFIRQHDITNLDDSLKVFEKLPDLFEKVDLIIHNSGIGEDNFDLAWEKDLPTLETNVLGATRIYQLSYNYFKNQKFGHLVSITSIASLIGNRNVPAYHASKAFQSNYMESLWMKARRTKKAKIHITNILPGYVDTDIITGETFWMAPLDKAVKQMYTAIQKKKRKAYITKRWRLVALMMNILPPQILIKMI